MINDPLANGQAHAYALFIHISCLAQLAKHFEELVHIFSTNTAAAINHPNLEKLFLIIVLSLQCDMLLITEFEGILCQVDEHLLQSNLIAYKLCWQFSFKW